MRMRPDRRMERLVLLPFAMGCVSESSVALAHHHHHNHHPTRTRSSSAAAPSATTRSNSCRRRKMDDDEESLSSNVSSDSKSSTTSSSTSPSSKISARFHRILRTFKSTFVYKEEEDDEEEEEMEIGVPTDVKHVTHIGWNDDVVVGAAAVASSMIPATITTTRTRVNNPMDLEHHEQGVGGSWDNNNPITCGQHQGQLLRCHHHRQPSSYEDEIGMGAVAAADPVLPRRPLSVISASSTCS